MTTLLTPVIISVPSSLEVPRLGYIHTGYILGGAYTPLVSDVNPLPPLTQSGFLVLLADGLVEEIEVQDPGAPHDARRRYYRMTERGRQAAVDEAALVARLTSVATRAGLDSSR